MIVKVEFLINTEYFDKDVVENEIRNLIEDIDPKTKMINFEMFKVSDK